MTVMQPTSLEAYYSLVRSGGLPRKRSRVLIAFLNHGPMTNAECAEYLEVPINEVTGRVKELRDCGLLAHKGTKIALTGKRNIVWGIKAEAK